MSAAAATNRVERSSQSLARELPGNTVNSSIPVGGMEDWKREAIQKLVSFRNLQENWDSHGSSAPNLWVGQTAMDILFHVPGGLEVGPRIVPTSGGGIHFEWSVGSKELEISIEPNCRVAVLKVENGMPLDDAAPTSIPELFGWLSAA